MDRIDILFVYLDDESYATKLDIKEFPAIVLFRNGDPLRFEGHVENEMAVLKVRSKWIRNFLNISITININMKTAHEILKNQFEILVCN